MARSANVMIGNWRPTGRTVSVPQYAVDLTITWVDRMGNEHSRTVTARFPNDLTLMGQDWLREELQELLLRAARKRFGVDD